MEKLINIDYHVSPSVVFKLSRAEDNLCHNSKVGGIERQRNIASEHNADKVIAEKPMYMKL